MERWWWCLICNGGAGGDVWLHVVLFPVSGGDVWLHVVLLWIEASGGRRGCGVIDKMVVVERWVIACCHGEKGGGGGSGGGDAMVEGSYGCSVGSDG